MSTILKNLVIDHQTATALQVGAIVPPVLFCAALLDCGHWQVQAEGPGFVAAGGELACARCAEDQCHLCGVRPCEGQTDTCAACWARLSDEAAALLPYVGAGHE